MLDSIFIILALLFIKHWYIDFVDQTNEEVAQKGNYLAWQGLKHSIKHGLATFLILFLATDVTHVDAMALGLVDFLIHYHVDWFKMRFGEKDSTKNAYWIWFGADQLMHQLTYITVIYFMITVFYPN